MLYWILLILSSFLWASNINSGSIVGIASHSPQFSGSVSPKRVLEEEPNFK